MKKYVALTLALLMLALSLCACAKKTTEAPAPAPVEEPAPVAETPEPTEEPEPSMIVMQEITPQNVVHKNTDEEIEAIAKEYCDQYYANGFDIERFRDDMQYVQPASSEDLFTVYDEKLAYLNAAPYNIGVKDIGNAESQFATSMQLAEEFGIETVEMMSERAIWYAVDEAGNVPSEMNVETLKGFFRDSGLSESKIQQMAEERVAFYNDYPFERNGFHNYDAAATYRAVDGTYRTRLEYASVMREASDAYVEKTGFNKKDIGKWTCCPAEVIMYPDEEGNPLDYELLFLGDMQYASKEESKFLEEDLKDNT